MKPRPGEIWIDGFNMGEKYYVAEVQGGTATIAFLDHDGKWTVEDLFDIKIRMLIRDGDHPDEATMVKRLIEEYELESR